MRKLSFLFKNIPLQLHISYLFVVLIVIFALTSNGIEYYQMRESLLEEAKDKTNHFRQTVTSELRNLYTNNELLLNIFARRSFTKGYTVEWYVERLDFFAAALENIPTLSAFYIGFQDGSSFILRPVRAGIKTLFSAPKGTAWLIQSRKQQQTAEWLFLTVLCI